MEKKHYLGGLLRIVMGWTFFWAFIDKMWGLGFTTTPEKSWMAGESPTEGFLSFATKGPFAEIYQSLAGQPWVDGLFMAGLLLIGLALLLGVGVKVAGYSGALLMAMMFTAVLPPEHNPVVDDHIINIFVLLIFTQIPVGEYLGFGKWWAKQEYVSPWMK